MIFRYCYICGKAILDSQSRVVVNDDVGSYRTVHRKCRDANKEAMK